MKVNIGKGIARAGSVHPYRRQPGDPVHRPLQIYSTDPADSKLSGSLATVNVPYEPLKPGPEGRLFKVVGVDQNSKMPYLPLDLEDPRILVQGGVKPSPTSYQFLMQMTYAVAMSTYDAFKRALGRDLHWGFDPSEEDSCENGKECSSRLLIFPFAQENENAFYDRDRRAVLFGWFLARNGKQRNLKDGLVFTGLSHDIIAHEVSHALLDGMRPNFLTPYHHETLALHEAFADLVAVFQHFGHRELVYSAIVKAKGELRNADLLTNIARQFGHTTKGSGLSLRTSVDDLKNEEGLYMAGQPAQYDPNAKIHDLGGVLVSAVFDAFVTIFERKVRRFIKLATNGTGELPKGDLPEALVEILAKQASKLASQFESICIRAIDYCPPMAVNFGDYLRAMITADYELVPSDPYGYREALVDAFIERKIPIKGVNTLSESSLLWPMAHEDIDLELLKLIHQENDDFANIAITPAEKYHRRAELICQYLLNGGEYERFGLLDPDEMDSKYRQIGIPSIESARICRRVSPDGALEIDLVVEIVQDVVTQVDGIAFPAKQGSTVIINSSGRLRYVINKTAANCVSEIDSPGERSARLKKRWMQEGDSWVEGKDLLAAIHADH